MSANEKEDKVKNRIFPTMEEQRIDFERKYVGWLKARDKEVSDKKLKEITSKIDFFNCYYGWEVLELLGMNVDEIKDKMNKELIEE